MPRRNLIRNPVYPYHVVNRANNKEWFQLPAPETWKILADECYGVSIVCGARIHAFVMMSNHFHMIVSSPELDLGEIMQHYGSSVTRAYNRKSGRNGHLFGGRYRWSLIDSPIYYAHALKYVYRNPVKAGLCDRVEDYSFSSLHGLCGKSYLPFPVSPLARETRHSGRIPDEMDSLLSWLNTPYRAEDSECIRRALRRKVFTFPVDRKTRIPSHLESGLV